MESDPIDSIAIDLIDGVYRFAGLTAGLGVTASEGNAIAPPLALRALSLKYVSAICSVDMAAGWFQALHAIGKLAVVSAGDPTMPGAPLAIPIDEADAGCFSTTVRKLTHDSITVRRSSNRPTTQEARKE